MFVAFFEYCNDPKFLDKQVWANSADPNQTAPQTWGELIVNANALIMHSFFPLIQGND